MKRLAYCAVGLACGFAAIQSCGRGSPPNEEALSDIVVDQITLGAAQQVTQGRTIVIDPECFGKQMPTLEANVRQMLEGAKLTPVVIETHCNVEALPGEWTTLPSGRMNVTHVLLQVHFNGNERERTIDWSYVCGGLCAVGRSFKATWDGSQWVLSDYTWSVS